MRLKHSNFGVRLFESCTRTKPPDHWHIVGGPVTQGATRIVVQRKPDLGLRRWETEFGGHDPEDLPAYTFDFNGAANDRCVAAKALLPKRVTQDHIVVLSGSVFSWIESPAQLLTCAQD